MERRLDGTVRSELELIKIRLLFVFPRGMVLEFRSLS